ncbi:MAG TPA: LLM class flavin-dependent oxidoreductase [Chloroflexota bacterium]|nr:LLM class flavin-dependent oxidoreductase [Chloroflexota bacterium]
MEIGIGLPSTVPDTPGSELPIWAREAEEADFKSLGIIDRLVYPNPDPLITLAAAAAVTRHIRLTTSILVAPLRLTADLAKQAASIADISGGRLVLGLGVGAREDDYTAVERPFHRRGRLMDAQMQEMRRLWQGGEINGVGPIGPTPPGGHIPLLVGGYSDAMVRRAVNWGDGYIFGSGGLTAGLPAFRKVAEAWRDAGRDGRPRFVGCTYFAIGEQAAQQTANALRSYYGPRAEGLIANSPLTAEAVRQTVADFAAAGVDEMILWPGSNDRHQITLLADLVL